MDNWKPLHEINFADESILQYHIDTRDFCCVAHTYKSEKLPDISSLIKYKDRFFYTHQEVSELINRYYNESGGKKEWRFFSLEAGMNWALKYIRIYRTEYGLIVCTRDSVALNREFTSSKVNVEHL